MKIYVVLESMLGDPEVVIGVCSSRERAEAVVREAYAWEGDSAEWRIIELRLDQYRFAD